MKIDLDSLQQKLNEYDPDVKKCDKTFKETRHYLPDGMSEDHPDAHIYRMVVNHSCCRPAGHDGECRASLKLMGWPGYRTFRDLIKEARRLSTSVDRLETESLELLEALGLHEDTSHEATLVHVRALVEEHAGLRSRIESCRWCDQHIVEGKGGHTSHCYEEKLNRMKRILFTIWDTDALQLWAFEDPDGEGSIASMVRDALKEK